MSSSPPPEPAHAPPRRAITLRTKLIVTFGSVIVVVCAVIGIVTQVLLADYLTRQLDDRVSSTQSRYGGPGRGGGHDHPPSDRDVQFFARQLCSAATGDYDDPRQPEGSVFAIAKGGNRFGSIQQDLTCSELPAATVTTLTTVPVGSRPVTVDLGRYGQYRVISTQSGSGAVMVTGLSTKDVAATQFRLLVIMLIVAITATVLAGVLVWLLLRRAMRPLERVAATARAVSSMPLHHGEVDLGVRVPGKDTDPRTEVGQVGAALNQMLGHVSHALSARHASESRVRRFVADASHELRTPLASIRGYAELARRNPGDADGVQHALTRVHSQAERMSALVDDLLLLARLDSGRPLALEPVDLTVLAIDAVSDARAAGPDHHWQLDLPAEPVSVLGDQARLTQVLTNLLANARVHTAPGTTVTTALHTEGDQLVLTVTDNGAGIDPQLQADIFGRFVRGDSSRSTQAGSTGLGLAIVAAVTTAHGGTVQVASRPGRTVFSIRLPLGGPDWVSR